MIDLAEDDMTNGFDSQKLSREKIEYLTKCSIPGCGMKVFRYRVRSWYGRPLCQPHYRRNRVFGHPLASSPVNTRKRSIPISSKRKYWNALNNWTRRFGHSFAAITAKRIGKDFRRNYVGIPYSASGPRIGSSKTVYPISTLLAWQELGWVRMEERTGEIMRFVVVVKSWNGNRMRLP